MKKKVLILGAGITGLSAAWKLSEDEYDVTIIEKDFAVGGLAKTIKFKDSFVDIGPHSFFSEDREIYDTVKSFSRILNVKSSTTFLLLQYMIL